MAVVSCFSLLKKADERGVALPAFNIDNMESALAVFNAVKKLKEEVIIQTIPKTLSYGGVATYPAMIRAMFDKLDTDVAIHLDHASVPELIRTAADCGFTSVMYDGSALPFGQNAANTADVRRVARLLGGFNPNAPVSEWADTLPEKLSLGELNLKYFTFLSAVKTLSDYQKDNTYEQQIKSLEEYIHWQRLLLEQTAADTATTLAKLNMLDKWLKRQNRLYGKDMIPEKEYDDMRTSRLNAYAEDRQLHRSLTSLHAQIAEAEGSLNLLRTQKAENERNMHLDLLSAYSDLLDNIKTWEEKYVFKAPMDGQVEFLQVFGENQYLQAGEEVFSVVPSRNAIFGQMLLPAAGAGKVKTDSPVIIKLDNYPYLEYGTIDGRVSSISLVTKNEEMAGSHVATYLITIELPQGLTTNYGQTLDFKHEIQGTAEIVANDRRLIERLFDNLKYRTH